MSETSLPTANALRLEWVERIFSVMSCSYGKRFAEQWATEDLGNIKRFWAQKLFPFSSNPHAIGLALDRMIEEYPNQPPNLPQFYGLCRKSVSQGIKPPSINPADQPTHPAAARMILEAAAEVVRQPKVTDARQWAVALRKRYLAHEPLTMAQIDSASQVLGEVWEQGRCTPFQREAAQC